MRSVLRPDHYPCAYNFMYGHNQAGGIVVNVAVRLDFLSVSHKWVDGRLQKGAGPVGVTIS